MTLVTFFLFAVKHMLSVGQNLLSQDAPQSKLYRYVNLKSNLILVG